MHNEKLYHREFSHSNKEHILMLTTHGVHEWEIVPGLTDTGGQNVFVNLFTDELVQQGYKVTIANRGGYPHPITGEQQTGVIYKNPLQRIVYLEDGDPQFVRKEDMDGQVELLAKFLLDFLQAEGQQINLVISHYWDAAVVGALFQEGLGQPVPHVWVPHSLGEIKKRNVAQEQWQPLRIDVRITMERKILSQVDFVASTSPVISGALVQDYGYQQQPLWLPPCISTDRFHPRTVPKNAAVWSTLSQACGLPESEVRRRKIITEISRTDDTKRKDILLQAFAKVLKKHPDILLAVAIEEDKEPVGTALMQLISALGIRDKVAVLGSVWDQLPDLYAVTDLYCSPSIMEGFGMSAQEAAATEVPIVSSDLVPFVTEYLAGDDATTIKLGSGTEIINGAGALIVPPDDVEGFAGAIELLLSDEELRKEKGTSAFKATIPYFTWEHLVQDFLKGVFS